MLLTLERAGQSPISSPTRLIMTLKEALLIAARAVEGETYRICLCCSFEPLHLCTFLKAHLYVRLGENYGGVGRAVDVSTGLFGDLNGNIRRAMEGDDPAPVVAVVDWNDLDPRLGLREGYPVTSDIESGILSEAPGRLAGLEGLLSEAVGERRVVIALPSFPLPPWLPGLPEQSSALSLELEALVNGFAARCARAGAFVVSRIPRVAYDFRAHLSTGFPFPISYADSLAEGIAALVLPSAPKKGLIADLDDTLWKGVVGDDGAANVHWSLEEKARGHGLFQQFLGGLQRQGVLVGIASKNDRQPVADALARSDLLLSSNALFPVETSWGPKSEAIRRIASIWNIDLSAIVFVDDNPLELAEVQLVLPDVECHLFPPSDPVKVLELVTTLRSRFAREGVTDEDRMRLETIRRATELTESTRISDPESLIAGLDGQVSLAFSRASYDARAFELLNKTNQFNLNGGRWEESEFRRFVSAPDSVVCVASYTDRFGPLGKIAVAAGSLNSGVLKLDSWVLSCRAFSRRIEYSIVKGLFAHTHADAIEFVWKSTSRNGPMRHFLRGLLTQIPEAGPVTLNRLVFEQNCPILYSQLSIG
jgi:FkbH-like protein